MDEQRPLSEVMAILRDQHHFTATVRSFKRHIAEWGWRKNIHLRQGDDDLAVHVATVARYVVVDGAGAGARSGEPGEAAPQPELVRLASGQVVDLERLAEHIRRKRQKQAQQQQQQQQQSQGRRRQLYQHQHQHQRFTTSATIVPPLPWAVRSPEAFRVHELLFTHSRIYTFSHHGKSARTIRSAASVLARDRAAARRWADFADAVQDSLARGDVAVALRRMRVAPREVAYMVRARPSNILCSLFMFVLQVSSGWGVMAGPGPGAKGHGSEEDDGSRDNKPVGEFFALLKALFLYAASLAEPAPAGNVPRYGHSFSQIMRALAGVSEVDLSEVAFRAWAVTCEAWATLVSLGGGGGDGLAIPARCMRRWLDGGDKGNMMLVMSNVLEEKSTTCDAEHGKGHEKSIVALQHRADLLAWALAEGGADLYSHPGLVELYREILDRGARGAARDKALEFFAKGRASMPETTEHTQGHL